MRGDVDDAVQAGAHALFFPCGTGHMLGLDVHDMEDLGEVYVGYEGQPKSTQFGLKSLRLARPLKPGFVFTVEPGVYFIPELVRQWRAEGRFTDFVDYAAAEALARHGRDAHRGGPRDDRRRRPDPGEEAAPDDRGDRGGARRMKKPEVTRHPTLAPERARPAAWPLVLALLAVTAPGRALTSDGLERVERGEAARDPKTLVWYAHPADKWENALPLGNGRLGAMVFGRTDEEEIQLNEETLWSGGPYSTTVRGGYEALPEIRRLIFDGQLIRAHRLFGRHLMGHPVEQQKYQSLGSLVLKLEGSGDVSDYRHELDLDTAVVTTRYTQRRRPLRRARCS